MEVIEDLGMDNTMLLALVIIGLAVLITIVLLMSYFTILVSIASFAYPNARLRAIGNPFIKKPRLTELLEMSSAQEAALEISKEGYSLPSNIEKVGIDETERALEAAFIQFLKKAIASNPQSIKPFLETFITKYDAAQIKKALHARKNNMDNEKLKKKLLPVKEITEEIIDNILETSTVDEALNALRTTKFGDLLIKASGEHKEDIVALDLALDTYYSKELRLAITRVDTAVRETVTIYIGKYVDITNIKYIIRSKHQDLDATTTERFLMKGGRNLAPWKLSQMIEVKGIQELATELEGTPYSETMREALQKYNETNSIYELEAALDRLLLRSVQEISSSALITAGPTIKFLVAKEFEIRNLKAVLRGLYEKLPSDAIMPLLIMEEWT